MSYLHFTVLNTEDKELRNHSIFIDIATSFAKFSKAKRLKVGALIVSNRGRMVGSGFNGTPQGVDNCCETSKNSTHDYVIHAELNAILNATTSDLRDSSIYLTHSPCIKCAAAILQVGIKTVIYKDEYRIKEGVDFLLKHNVNIVYLDV